MRLLSGPAIMPHEFGFLFSLHSLKRLFSSQDTDWSYGQHLPHGSGSIVFADLPEVRGLGLSLFHAPYWTCFFGCALWSCCYLAPSKVVWVVGLCKDRTFLADPYLAKVPQEVCIGVGLC